MGSIDKQCFGCSRRCNNTNFCLGEDGTNISLPNSLKITIHANPEYWGFSGVLSSGWLKTGQAFYDYFDGFEENFETSKTCGDNTTYDNTDIQRPDIKYATKVEGNQYTHYPDDLDRGGPESYLLNYSNTKQDLPGCDNDNPADVFKWNPLSYSFRPKILFNDKIFRNITNAWRGDNCTNCYDFEEFLDSGCGVCSGEYKQHIEFDDHFTEYYDPYYLTCVTGDGKPDGTIPDFYSGLVETGVKTTISYSGTTASALSDGNILFFKNSSNDGAFTIFNVSHTGTYTDFDMVGVSTPITGGEWVAPNRPDPATCEGGAALGINSELKCDDSEKLFHVDIGRVFNNPKNKEWHNRGAINPTGYGNCTHDYDLDYFKITESGTVELDDSGVPVKAKTLPYFGDYSKSCDTCKRVSFVSDKSIGNNGTCYTENQEIAVFPDCVLQYCSWQDPVEGTKYRKNLVPRLAINYRPCKFNDPCSFDDSGRPWTAGADSMPSTLDDLRKGFGGQEVQMYVNVGTAWNSVIDCEKEIVHTVDSPITFPCFPKFDLYPEKYGCEDPLWYNKKKNDLGLVDSGVTACSDDFFDACWIRQPYPTYGYIRNLCGHRDISRREAIDSLSNISHSGEFTDLVYTSGSNEPMYVDFTGAPYWGLTDDDGKLVAPHHHVKECTTGLITHDCFDSNTTTLSGWPTSGVPFLIEIDHKDQCVGCATTSMQNRTYNISFDSLPESFLHNHTIDGVNGSIFGYNHCSYGVPKPVVVPDYKPDDTWEIPTTYYDCGETGNLAISAYPYTGETCACVDGDSHTLYPVMLSGTEVPKYYSTSGVNNSYVKFGTCGSTMTNNSSADTDAFLNGFGDKFQTYVRARITCLDDYYHGNYRNYPQFQQGLDKIFGCGDCEYSYPATNHKPNLQLSWYYVNPDQASLFEQIPDSILDGEYDWLYKNITYGVGACINTDPADPGCSYGDEDCSACSGTDLVHMSVPFPACTGSKVTFYGCKFIPETGTGSRTCTGGGYMTKQCLGDVNCGVGTGVAGTGCCEFGDKFPTVEDGNIWRTGCYDLDSCGNVEDDFNYPSNIGLCGCTNYTPVIEVEYKEDPCGSGIYDWFATFHAPPREIMELEDTAPIITAWSAENIQGIGNIPLIPIDDWVAYPESAFPLTKNDLCIPNPESTCSWANGVNQLTQVGATRNIPSRDVELQPETCTITESGITRDSMCVEPIPFGKFSGSLSKVNVQRKYEYPEIVRVVKVECDSSGDYTLHIDREFYEHDRKHYQEVIVDGEPTDLPLYGRIDGGGVATLYELGGNRGVAKPGEAVPSGATIIETGTYYGIIPMASKTDTVSDCYPDVCTTSDLTYQKNLTFDTTFYPDLSGIKFWNFYNIFYDSGVPDSKFLDDSCQGCYLDPESDDPFPFNLVCISGEEGSPILGTSDSGVDVKCLHSCIQDQIDCGSELLCNKEFFPRRKYKTGTRVARISSHSICISKGKTENPSWACRVVGDPTMNDLIQPPPTPFVDYCISDNYTTTKNDVEISGTTIKVGDIWPLIGNHPGFINTVNKNTCINATGCIDHLPLHNDSTINAATGLPENIREEDLCLLNPFDIMLDVECCNEKFGRDPFEDDPLYLSWVVQDVNSVACEGFMKDCNSDCATCKPNCLNGAEFIPVKAIAFGKVTENICLDGSENLYDESGALTGCDPGTPVTTYTLGASPDIIITDLQNQENIIDCLTKESGVVFDCDFPDICDSTGFSLNGTSYFDMYDWNGEKYNIYNSGICFPLFKYEDNYYYDVNKGFQPDDCVACERNFCELESSKLISITDSGCFDLKPSINAAMSASGFCDINDCFYIKETGDCRCNCGTCGGSCGCSSIIKVTVTESA